MVVSSGVLQSLVHLFHFFEGVENRHFSLAVAHVIFKFLHFVVFGIELEPRLEDGLGVSNVSPCFVVPAGTMFADVVMLFGVRSHRNLGMATRALKVKTEDLDTEVVHVEARFFSHVEFGADVKKVTASVAPNTHWQHHSNIVLFVFFVLYLF